MSEQADFDFDRAKKWFTRLKKVMNAMPDDCELLVSGFGVMTLMPTGAYAANSGAADGMDSLAANYGVFEHDADRVMGENCTI